MDIAFLVGRIIFGGYFILAAYNLLANGGRLVGHVASKGIPVPRASIFVSGLLVLIGGLSIVTGYMPVVGVAAIILFLIPVSVIIYPYWRQTDPKIRMADKIQFQKNMALVGAALAFLGASAPWTFSL